MVWKYKNNKLNYLLSISHFLNHVAISVTNISSQSGIYEWQTRAPREIRRKSLRPCDARRKWLLYNWNWSRAGDYRLSYLAHFNYS